MPGGRGEHGRVGAGQHRQAEAAGDDRGVRAGAAADRDGAGQVPRVDEADQVGGVDVGADQDERGLGRRRRGRVACQPGVDRRGDLADVARPLREVRVGQRRKDRGLGFRRRGDRGGRRRQRVTPGSLRTGSCFAWSPPAPGALVAASASSAGADSAGSAAISAPICDDVRLVVASRRAEPAGERARARRRPRRRRRARRRRSRSPPRRRSRRPCPPRCRRPRPAGKAHRPPPPRKLAFPGSGGHGAPVPASRAAASRRAVRISTVEAAPGSS